MNSTKVIELIWPRLTFEAPDQLWKPLVLLGTYHMSTFIPLAKTATLAGGILMIRRWLQCATERIFRLTWLWKCRHRWRVFGVTPQKIVARCQMGQRDTSYYRWRCMLTATTRTAISAKDASFDGVLGQISLVFLLCFMFSLRLERNATSKMG